MWKIRETSRSYILFTLLMFLLLSAQKSFSLSADSFIIVDDFNRPNSLYHGDGWETLNPGYWEIKDKALRRRLHNVGDHNPVTYFPWHWETHRNKPMPVVRDPSLPFGMIWRRDWKLEGNYTIKAEFTIKNLAPVIGKPHWKSGEPVWKQETPGYGVMGVCFGGKTLYESREGKKSKNAAWMALWRDNNTFGIYDHSTDKPEPVSQGIEKTTPAFKPGDKIIIEVAVSGSDLEKALIKATLIYNKNKIVVICKEADRKLHTNGFFGIVARGLLDFEVNRVIIDPGNNKVMNVPLNDLHVCYPLGDALKKEGDNWICTFVAIFRNDGKKAEIRISDSEYPRSGWKNVPVAGSAPIVNNEFRRNTAVIRAKLPFNPSEKTMYYTVWKDGRNVTGDPRIGTASIGPGTGLIEPPIKDGNYVGRLPQLKAPYRIAGLGGHAIHGGNADLPNIERFGENFVHDQPTPNAYRYIEDYNFQILDWDDDVWYLELLFPPPSTDDAYKIITYTIAGPTSRWMMMRHWNIINPGDHDFGMDDIKGPEQYILRHHNNLGQDMQYLRRNYKIVLHLVTGDENPSGTDNPKIWCRWRMPDGDFSILKVDSRLWRGSQETDIWSDWGWGNKQNLFDRTNPVRTLLGEEQFAWLQRMIRTESAPLILVTGINNLHSIFGGRLKDPETGLYWNQRDRVTADYASWVKAGCDRIIDLFGSRQGIVSVYGDIHLAHILENKKNRFLEASFGPIGRYGGRRLKEDWAPEMVDYDGRAVKIYALYHYQYISPDLKPHTGPKIWNFMDMTFDPRKKNPKITMIIRNIIDSPKDKPRGGRAVEKLLSQTGRPISCTLPKIKTLPNAEVHFYTIDGQPICGTRSFDDGSIPLNGLIDIAPNTKILIVSYDGVHSESRLITTGKL